MKRIAIMGFFLVAGCGLFYEQRPPCPLKDLTAVAVLPVTGAPGGQEERFGEILAGELVQFPGIERVVRPQEACFVQAAHNLDRHIVPDLYELGRELGVDGVLVADLYEFDMHEPPRAVIWCALVTNPRRVKTPEYALTLVRTGRIPPTAGCQESGILTVERVYEADDRMTAARLEVYAQRKQGEVAGLDGVSRVRRIGANFFGFVSEQTIRDLFSQVKEKASDDRSKDCDRKFVYSEGY